MSAKGHFCEGHCRALISILGRGMFACLFGAFRPLHFSMAHIYIYIETVYCDIRPIFAEKLLHQLYPVG